MINDHSADIVSPCSELKVDSTTRMAGIHNSRSRLDYDMEVGADKNVDLKGMLGKNQSAL